MSDRKLIHIDADCFFAAVEMRRQPRLLHKPFAVGGSPTGRGVIATCNYSARAYGVRSAMSSAEALRLCPDLQFVTPDMALYRKASAEMFSLFGEYSDVVDTVSIDEAFLDVSGSGLFSGSATWIAKDLQRRVKEELGLSVSAGVAPVKFLAKIASDWNKPHGLFTIAPASVEQFMPALNLRLLPGVGTRTHEKLTRLGLFCCGDVQAADPVMLESHFGSFAKRLREMAFGKDDREVGQSRQRKSISVEHTFNEDVSDSRVLVGHLTNMLHELERRRQSRPELARLLVSKRILKLRFSDFSSTSIETKIPSCSEVAKLCEFERLAYLARRRHPGAVRLLGIGYRFSSGDSFSQLSLPLAG